MASVNKCIIVGNLGKDPETRYLASGDPVTHITVATTEKWTDKASGSPKEQTDWHRVVFFKRLAEVAAEYLKKGSQVYIEGRIRNREYDDKNGQKRYVTEIHADSMQMLGGKPKADDGAGYRAAKEGRAPAQKVSDNPFGDDDDIPY